MADKREYELAVKIVGMVDKTLGSSCDLTKKQIRSIAKAAADADAGKMGFKESWAEAGKGIDVAWNGAKKAVVTTAEAMLAAGVAVAGIGMASIETGREFEAAMSSWSATATATNGEYALAREAAMEWGRKTSKTATESAEALEYMALAGWSVQDSIAGLPGVLRLSEATGLDLARTSDLVTDSMSALGIEIQDLGIYLDVAAAANNKSNQTAEHLMNAYLGVGGTMKNLRVPIQESATALGVLANRGIKGSEAGNALNAVMVNLTTGTGQAGKMMKKLKVSAFDAKGNFIGLSETLNVLDRAISKLNEEDRNKALAAIGGKQHVDALNALMSGLNTTVAEGVTEWENLEQQLYGSAGALERMADTKIDNLTGDLAIMQSALQDTGIRIYDNLQDPLREAAQGATQLIYEFSDNIVDGLKTNIPTIRRHAGDIKDALETFAEPLLKVGGWMVNNPDVIAGGLAAIGTTITTLKLAKTITSTATAMNALRLAVTGNPVTAAIGVAALAGGAIVGIATKVKIANTELKKQKLSDSFGNITLSLSELQDTARDILDKETLKDLGLAMGEMKKVSSFADDISNSSDALRKLTWKVSMGMELNESDQTLFQTSIDSMIQNSIALVEQARYTAHLNVNALFGGESQTGNELITGFDALYEGINEQIKIKGMQLGAVYKNAMEDGIIDSREAKIIQELQAELARITDQVAQSQLDARLERIHLQYSGKDLDKETFQNLQKEIQSQITEASASAGQSYEYSLGALKLQLDRSQSGEITAGDAAYLTQTMYDSLKRELDAGLLERQMELELKGINFQTQTIADAFSEDLSEITPQMGKNLNLAMEETLKYINWSGNAANGWTYDQVAQWLDIDGLDKATRDALKELWSNMEPEFNNLLAMKNQYEAVGKEVPESVKKGINDAAAIGILAGSADALWSAMGSTAESSPQFQEVLATMHNNGVLMPDGVAKGIKDNADTVKQGINSLYLETNSYLKQKFNSFTIDSTVNVNYSVQGSSLPFSVRGAAEHADGGIFQNPHLGWVAEAGYPEAIIPLDGSRNAVSIWEEAGERLGIFDKGTNNSMASQSSAAGAQNRDESRITYAPVFNVPAGSEGRIKEIAENEYQKFEQFMKQFQRDNKRLAF